MTSKRKNWWTVKAEIIGHWGTLSACAGELACSTEGLRQAYEGRCPGIKRRLEKALADRRELQAA